MGTVQTLLDSARYDLHDYETGIQFDDTELLNYLNRLIKILDSSLASLSSDLVEGEEADISATVGQNYVDLMHLNNGYWDSIKNVWIQDNDQLIRQSLSSLRKLRIVRSSGNAVPYYFAIRDRRLLFDCTSSSTFTDMLIYYNQKSRPRVASYSSAFTASASTDTLTLGSSFGFVTGDGPFTLTTTNTLPAGLSLATNYYVIFNISTPTGFQLATSQANALDGTEVDITDTGTGTHTIAMASSVDTMPYDGIFDELFLEMLAGMANAKAGKKPAPLYQEVFRRRAMEETIRRGFIPKPYHVSF